MMDNQIHSKDVIVNKQNVSNNIVNAIFLGSNADQIVNVKVARILK